jgi:plasmid stabilization system protein ParE
MKRFWTEPAIQDLRDLRDYIAADSDFHAADFIASIITRAERLTTFPMIGRVVPEAQGENIREILYRGATASSTESLESESMCSRSSTAAGISGARNRSLGKQHRGQFSR